MAESPYKPPQREEESDVVPVPSTTGLVLRVTAALLGVIALAVGFLTRELWLAWLFDEPLVGFIGLLVGSASFTYWTRRPVKSGTPRRRVRLRDRRRR